MTRDPFPRVDPRLRFGGMNLVRAVLTALLFCGCPSKSERSAPAPQACTAFGQRCEFAPGKLGACVVRENCTGKDCLVCQSQH